MCQDQTATNREKRQPYPLTWHEQSSLFSGLPKHLAEMALFAVNTGCRSAEVCSLLWEWEVEVPELGVSVFIIPRDRVKNGDERLVVLNSVAASVIERQRGQTRNTCSPIVGNRCAICSTRRGDRRAIKRACRMFGCMT